MTAIIHMSTGQIVTVEKMEKIVVKQDSGLGDKVITPADVATLPIYEKTNYAFVGETSTFVFAQGSIQYVEFTLE